MRIAGLVEAQPSRGSRHPVRGHRLGAPRRSLPLAAASHCERVHMRRAAAPRSPRSTSRPPSCSRRRWSACRRAWPVLSARGRGRAGWPAASRRGPGRRSRTAAVVVLRLAPGAGPPRLRVRLRGATGSSAVHETARSASFASAAAPARRRAGRAACTTRFARPGRRPQPRSRSAASPLRAAASSPTKGTSSS